MRRKRGAALEISLLAWGNTASLYRCSRRCRRRCRCRRRQRQRYICHFFFYFRRSFRPTCPSYVSDDSTNQLYPIDDRFRFSRRSEMESSKTEKRDAFNTGQEESVKRGETLGDVSRCRIVWNLRDAPDATFPYRRGANRCARYRSAARSTVTLTRRATFQFHPRRHSFESDRSRSTRRRPTRSIDKDRRSTIERQRRRRRFGEIP